MVVTTRRDNAKDRLPCHHAAAEYPVGKLAARPELKIADISRPKKMPRIQV